VAKTTAGAFTTLGTMLGGVGVSMRVAGELVAPSCCPGAAEVAPIAGRGVSR
jgi:hypothetical protein